MKRKIKDSNYEGSAEQWYQKGAWIVVLIILFFPLGLAVMWKHAKWSLALKVILTGFFALVLLNPASRTKTNDIDSILKNQSVPTTEIDREISAPVSKAELEKQTALEMEKKYLEAALEACTCSDLDYATFTQFIPSDIPEFAPLNGYWSCYGLAQKANNWNQVLECGRSWRGLREDWRFVNDSVFQTYDHHNGEIQSEFILNDDGYWYGFAGVRGWKKDTRIRFINPPEYLSEIKQSNEAENTDGLNVSATTEAAILRLHEQGKNAREIAKEIGSSRHEVKLILRKTKE